MLARNAGLPGIAFADQLGQVKPGTRREGFFQRADEPVQVLADTVKDLHNFPRIAAQDLDPQRGIAGGDPGDIPQAVTGEGESMKRRPLQPAGQQ